MSNVDCERGFSVLDFIKNKFRILLGICYIFLTIFLGPEKLDMALRVSLEGPEDFDYLEAYMIGEEKGDFITKIILSDILTLD